MSCRCKVVFFLFIIFFPLYALTQNNENLTDFRKIIAQQTTQFKNHKLFSKTLSFFVEEESDSTLVYTKKILSSGIENKELIDYCHFFRGFSFYKKNLLTESEKEFSKVSPNFKYFTNVIAFLGTVSLEASQFDKALNYYKRIEYVNDNELLITNISKVKGNIGVCYLHLQKFEKAEKYLTKTLQLQEKLKDTLEIIGSYGNLANVYYEQYKDAEAIPLFQKAYQLAKTTDDFIARQNTSLNMAVVEENRKDLAKALQYRKEYEQWKDSINNQSKIYAVAKAEEKIAIEKEQKQVAVLKAKNEVQAAQRNTYLYSAIILLILFGVSLYFYRLKVKSNNIINAQKEDLDELNATKDKLFSIVSHDLRSSVNAIKVGNKKLIQNIESQDIVEAKNLLYKNSTIVNSAYNLLDNLLNWALLQTKQSFFQITKLQLEAIVAHVAFNYKAILDEKKITFKNAVAKKAIVFADQESLKIILRNLIDNAIKFTNAGGNITIYSEDDHSDFLHLIVKDTGIGMDEDTRNELLKDTTLLAKKKHENIIGTGLGMQLCKSMIQKNNGAFSIESKLGEGTKMIVSLPKKPT